MKKSVLAIVIALVVLCAVIGTVIFTKKPKEEDPVPETTVTEPVESTPAESDVTIIENQGDIEIIIPEDMESDGF